MSPPPYDLYHWRSKAFWQEHGSNLAACVELKDPHKTILFVDDEEAPINFPDIGSAMEYATDLCSS